MNKAAILSAVRYRVHELSTDEGTLLDDSANLLDFINEAIEEVILDLVPFMESQLMGNEDIDLIAGQANYSLSAEWLQIIKIERLESGKSPREIKIITPGEKQFYMNVGDTEQFPRRVYEEDDVFYFVKTPSTSITDYCKFYFIKNEATALPTDGPTVIPRMAHYMIVHKACSLVAIMLEVDSTKFDRLYVSRLAKVARVWAGRFQTQNRYIQEGEGRRQLRDERDTAFFDEEWN